MRGAHLHSVGLHVRNLDTMLAFYRLLGLDVPSPRARIGLGRSWRA